LERNFPSGAVTGMGSISGRIVVGEVDIVEDERVEVLESVLD
jgi:hypothetical protein